MSPPRSSTNAFFVTTSVTAVLLTFVPFVIAQLHTRTGLYLWAGTSPTDFAVYLEWIKQASQGCVLDHHPFAGGQRGMVINPVYLVLGAISGLTHISGTAVYHIGRVVCGMAMLYVVWRFIKKATDDPPAQRMAFLFVCFSSGFGWLIDPLLHLHYFSIDRWQTEAFTFLCLYTYPHFCVSLMLQVGILYLLIRMFVHGSRKDAVLAGVYGSVLVIEHTYDLITVAAVWLTFLGVARERGLSQAGEGFRNNLIAGALTMPGVIYMVLMLHLDSVFAAARHADTLSLPLPYTLIGYGGELLLAIIAAVEILRNERTNEKKSILRNNDDAPAVVHLASRAKMREAIRLMLVVWAVVNMAVSYIPVAFQRKLIQGDHIALSILAGIGAAHLLRGALPGWNWDRLRWPELAITAFLAVGNVVYLYKDTRDILSGLQQRQYRPTLSAGEAAAVDWVNGNTRLGDVVQPIPWIEHGDVTLLLFVPGLTGRPEYCGHWAETPDCATRLDDVTKIAEASTSEPVRKALVHIARIDYLIFSEKRDTDAVVRFAGLTTSPMFRRVYGNADADVYQVVK